MRKPLVAAILSAALLIHSADVFCASRRAAQLDDLVPLFEAKNQTWHEVVGSVNQEWTHDLTIGLVFYEEQYRQRELDKKINVVMSSASVREILDVLVREDTNYFWVADGDVINFIPRAEGVWSQVLNSTMSRCQVRDLGITEAVNEIVVQARKQGIRQLVQLPKSNLVHEYEPAPSERVSILLKKKSLRECLNAVVAARPPAYWMATPSRGGLLVQGAATGGEAVRWRKTGRPRKETKSRDIWVDE